jgi:hypothetical protein
LEFFPEMEQATKRSLYVRDTGAIIHEFAEGELVGLAQIEYGKSFRL